MYLLSRHAQMRMAQRGISFTDAELITLIGTEVDEGYLVRAKDCQRVEAELKRILKQVVRLRGKRLVTANGRIVTAFHASRRHERRSLRYAHEYALNDA